MAGHRDCHSRRRTSALMGKIKTLKRSIAALLEIKIQQEDCLQIKVFLKKITDIYRLQRWLFRKSSFIKKAKLTTTSKLLVPRSKFTMNIESRAGFIKPASEHNQFNNTAERRERVGENFHELNRGLCIDGKEEPTT